MEKSGINGEKFRQARCAPGAFGANGICSCGSLGLLALHHARLLGSSGAAANPAACESVAAASHARLLAGAAAEAPLAARRPAAPAPPAPLSAALGRTAMLPNPASLAGDDASAARYTPQRTRASNEALKRF